MRRSRNALLTFCLASFFPVIAAQAQYLPLRLVHPGTTLKLGFTLSIEPDCRSRGKTKVVMVVPPNSGRVTTRSATGFPNLPQTDSAAVCNHRRVPGTDVYYSANPGTSGPDSFTLQYQFPNGFVKNTKYDVVIQ